MSGAACPQTVATHVPVATLLAQGCIAWVHPPNSKMHYCHRAADTDPPPCPCLPAGELNFVLIGVILQLVSICTESTRLTLVQLLLQSRGLKLNPVTTM